MVVSDSSPLIFYARIGRLDLLREVFATVHIPMAVRDEISFGGGNRSGAAQVAAMPWILLHPVVNRERVGVLRARLGPGEAEAITLAGELGQAAILLDDGRGRRSAQECGLRVFGSGGVLAQAKRQGLLPRVRPVLDELRDAGLYLSDGAYREVLASVGE